MSKFNSLLMGRFKSHAKKEKMNELVERSSSTPLTSFSGAFQVNPISNQERASLQSLLEKYQTDERLKKLSSYAVAWSWTISLMVVTFIYWLNYLK